MQAANVAVWPQPTVKKYKKKNNSFWGLMRHQQHTHRGRCAFVVRCATLLFRNFVHAIFIFNFVFVHFISPAPFVFVISRASRARAVVDYANEQSCCACACRNTHSKQANKWLDALAMPHRKPPVCSCVVVMRWCDRAKSDFYVHRSFTRRDREGKRTKTNKKNVQSPYGLSFDISSRSI